MHVVLDHRDDGSSDRMHNYAPTVAGPLISRHGCKIGNSIRHPSRLAAVLPGDQRPRRVLLQFRHCDGDMRHVYQMSFAGSSNFGQSLSREAPQGRGAWEEEACNGQEIGGVCAVCAQGNTANGIKLHKTGGPEPKII